MINRRNLLQYGLASMGAFVPSFKVSYAVDGFVELIASPKKQELYNTVESDLWTFGGKTPGPEIRARKGDEIKIRLVNQLPEPTSIHWHGIRIENSMDGVSGLTQKPVMPGESFDYQFIVPDAGTYWYHAHNKSWNQVARGLYGPLIIEEHNPQFSRANDITLVLDDWLLNQKGELDNSSLGSLMEWSHAGRLGNWFTVNGQPRVSFSVEAGGIYRLRLINASNSRTLKIDPKRIGAEILAFDGQPVKSSGRIPVSPLSLGSAQRVDLLVIPEAGNNFAIEELSGRSPFPFAEFKVEGNRRKNTKAVNLPSNNIPEPDLNHAKKFKLHMSGGAMGRGGDIVFKGSILEGDDFVKTRQFWAFNGIANLAKTPFFSVRKGETVEIELFNDTAFSHAMHVHGHHFLELGADNSDHDYENIWRDTFMINPTQTRRIAFVADNPGDWLIHCHMLEHAAAGMTSWFEVK